MNRPEGISPEAMVAAKAAAILIFDKLLDEGRIAVISIEARDAAALPIAKAIQSSVEAERERAASYHDDMAAQHEAFRSEATGVGIEHHAKMVRFHVLSAERIRKGA